MHVLLLIFFKVHINIVYSIISYSQDIFDLDPQVSRIVEFTVEEDKSVHHIIKHISLENYYFFMSICTKIISLLDEVAFLKYNII